MGKTSSAVKNRYNAKAYDRVGLMLPKGYKDRMSRHAKSNGESVNSYVKRLIDADMGVSRDNSSSDGI